MKKILTYLVVVLAFVCGFAFGRKGHRIAPETQVIVKTDTLLRYDTITREKPILRFSEVIRYDTVTVLERDTVFAVLPVERKVYEEDSLYRAVVCGYNASLDSITVWPKTVVINTEKTVYKTITQSRWGIGASAGPSVILAPSGRIYGGIGVTAGVTYRF